MRIEPLDKTHNLKPFDCAVESLNKYLHEYARQDIRKDQGRTYLMVTDEGTIVGYYTISTGSIEPHIVPTKDRLSPYRPTPVIVLGRFAVDRNFHGQDLGTALLMDCFRRCLEVVEQVGGYAICLDVDKTNPKVKGFYLKHDFQELKDDPMHLFIPMKTVRELNLSD